MDPTPQLNHVEGHWIPAASGLVFETRTRLEPFAPSGTWPRSSGPDVSAALRAAALAAPGWADRPRAQRLELLRTVPGELERMDLGPALAADLGLEPVELSTRLAEELFRFSEGLELLEEGPAASGVGLFRAHWSDLLGGLGARLATRLVSGRTAVLFSDPLLPRAAAALTRAFEAADPPPGVLGLLHDDSLASLEAGLLSSEPSWVRLKGHEDRLRSLRRRFSTPASREWSLWSLRNSSLRVPAGADAALEAASAVEKAFGRSSTLSGQWPGQIGRVLCHQELFSNFSEELLARLEDHPDVRRPVPALDADLTDYVASAWALGLDEGATPIFGGAPSPGSPARRDAPQQPARGVSEARGVGGGARQSQDGGQRGRRAPHGVPPAVFTNVESHQRFSRLGRPAPILGLMRVPSDEVGARLAARLDRPVDWASAR